MSNPKRASLSKKVIKATGMFGGVQIISVFCSLIRNKLIALWIGEAGIGLFAMLNAAVDMLAAVTQLGTRTSSVRSLAEAHESGNHERLLTMIKTVRRWAWILGLTGVAVTLAASPLLSVTIFNNSHTLWPFFIIATVILFNTLQEADKAMLQASEKLPALARASIWGAVGGTVLTIPIIYCWRMQGVAPAILSFSLSTLIGVYITSRNNIPSTGKVTLSFSQAAAKGKEFIKMGFFLMIASLFTYATSYLFLTILNHWADINEVGLYQTGQTLTVRYIAFIFTAIGVEYYPRLAKSFTHGQRRMQIFMRHETAILLPAMLIVGSLMAAFAPFVVRVLYSDEFTPAVPMIVYALPGIAFRAASWCTAFTLIAAGKARPYLCGEIIGSLMLLACNITGYHLGGLAGIGISFSVYYFLYYITTATIARHFVNVSLSLKLVADTILTAAVIAAVGFAAILGYTIIAAGIALIAVSAGCYFIVRLCFA